jgi:hypothetical protein
VTVEAAMKKSMAADSMKVVIDPWSYVFEITIRATMAA